MMATTHALVGLTAAAFATFAAPEYAVVIGVAAFTGGVFPDLDLYADHRKALHFPSYYSITASVALAAFVAVPNQFTASIAFFLIAAAAHSVMDSLGGGLELEPWLSTSDRAVYDHLRGRWLPPRRWVRYDGAPEDAAFAVVLAVPALTVYDGALDTVILALLAVSVGYATVRKHVPEATRLVVSLIPNSMRLWLPRRFIEG